MRKNFRAWAFVVLLLMPSVLLTGQDENKVLTLDDYPQWKHITEYPVIPAGLPTKSVHRRKRRKNYAKRKSR